MDSIFRDAKISQQALKAADNETLTGATIDMQGYDSVIFIASIYQGEASAWTLKAQQGAASDMSDAADLLGTGQSITPGVSTNALGSLEIHKPQERYVRTLLIAPNITTAAAASVIAIQFNAKEQPITNTGELHVSPAEGTA